MYSPEAEPFEDIQTGSPPISPSSNKREDYVGTAWKRRSSVSSTEHQPRPVFDSITVPQGINELGPATFDGAFSTSPTKSSHMPPSSPTRSTRLSGVGRRLSRTSAKSFDRVPSSPPPSSVVPLASPPAIARQQQPKPPPSPEAPMTAGTLAASRLPPHAALASPPMSSTLSSSRRTSGSSVDKMTPPSSSSSLSSIPGLGPSQFAGGLAPDLSNPYRSQMERPLDTVKRLSRQVDRPRDYTRGAPSAGPSSFRTEDMYSQGETKSNHSPTPSSHSAPPFVMSGAYPSAVSMSGPYPTPMNRLPSALAMSGPYPTRGSNLSSFENPWPTWEGPSSSTIDAKLASKKARRMSSAPNQQLDGDQRKSDRGSRKSRGKEREHLSPNGSPTLGSTYSPSPLSQASSPVTSTSPPPVMAAPAPPRLERSGSSKGSGKAKKRLSIWGRGKSHDGADGREEDDARARTVSAPTDTVSQGFSPPPPLPPMPATISLGRRSNGPRSSLAHGGQPEPLTISTSELGVADPGSSSASSTKTSTPASSGGLFSKFGSHRGRPKELTKTVSESPTKPAAPAMLAVPGAAPMAKKGGRDASLRDEAKEEKGLGGLWKRLSVSRRGSKSPVSPVAPTATTPNVKTTGPPSPNGTARPNGKTSTPASVVAVAMTAPRPAQATPASTSAPPPQQGSPARAPLPTVAASPTSNGSSSATPTRGDGRQAPEVRVGSPPSSDRTVRASQSPPRPAREQPVSPSALYGSNEVGTGLPPPQSPVNGSRGLPSPTRGLPSKLGVAPSSSMPSFRHPSAPPTSQYLPTGALPPGLQRRGNSYEPSSPSAAAEGDYADILARCASHPSRPPTPPPKVLTNGHALEMHHSGASDSQSGSGGSELSNRLWEPRTAGSSFTAYSSSGPDSGSALDAVKV